MNLFSGINAKQRALDVSGLRHRLITNNIANVDTPGYKAMELSFQDVLSKEVARSDEGSGFIGRRTDPRHFSIGRAEHSIQPKVKVENKTSVLNNENNVDVDYEMTKLAENNIWYNSVTQMVNKEFSLLRYVITEGRR